MIIKKVFIDDETKFKIYNKHGVKFSEIEQALLLKNKFVKKIKEGKYIALTKSQRYLTIIFSMENGMAGIITAYPSSRWQIDLFQRRSKNEDRL